MSNLDSLTAEINCWKNETDKLQIRLAELRILIQTNDDEITRFLDYMAGPEIHGDDCTLCMGECK